MDSQVPFITFYPWMVFLVFSLQVSYIRISVAVQRHKNQIHALQVQQAAENGETSVDRF